LCLDYCQTLCIDLLNNRMGCHTSKNKCIYWKGCIPKRTSILATTIALFWSPYNTL